MLFTVLHRPHTIQAESSVLFTSSLLVRIQQPFLFKSEYLLNSHHPTAMGCCKCCYYFVSIFLIFLTCKSHVQVLAQADEASSLQLKSDSLEWPMAMSLFDGDLRDNEEEIEGISSRRSLFWHRMRYYISYAALSANRIPCPPRSGRSYYTHNCYFASGPVHPYTRGCSAITRCRR